jgi:hypothetical protein
VGSFGPKLNRFALGEDDRPLELGEEVKSISGEETFQHDTDDRGVLRACLRAQAADIAATLKRRHLAAHTIQVKVRYGDFTTLTRQLTVEEPIAEARDIYRLGCFLLGRERLVRRPLRLLGLGVSNLREPTTQQLVLLESTAWNQFRRTRHTHHPVDDAKGNAEALLHFETLGLRMPAWRHAPRVRTPSAALTGGGTRRLSSFHNTS